jgi:4-amino-4-deoxy-L-arabinose transferase-like glycosyltransferase
MDVKKGRWPRVFIILGVLLGIYFLLRLFNLTLLPIFTDEAIYIRWSQIGSADANWRFISLTDGKQPLFTWIMMIFLRVIKDPLFAGRFVSVCAGAATLVGAWFLSTTLFRNTRVSLLSSLLYLITPFMLMYDRMALYDSLVATLFIWNLYLSVQLVRLLRLDIAMMLGIVLGLGMLNKSIGFLSLYLLPFTLLLFDWNKENVTKRLVRWVLLSLLAGLISQVMYAVLRLSPFYHMISLKDSVFVYPIKEWILHPLRFFEGNVQGLFDWLWHYLTLPLFLLSLAPLFLFTKYWREKLLLYIYWLFPFVALALFGKVLYPRFILFMAVPLLLLESLTLQHLSRRLGKSLFAIGIYVVLFLPSIYTDYFILFNPKYAPIPYSDSGQFIDDWPAGWGVEEVNAFLSDQSMKGKVTVYTEGTFGLLPYAIEIYLITNPNMEIHGIWPLSPDMPKEMLASAKSHPTYFVLNQTQIPPPNWPLVHIADYQKGKRVDRKLQLFKVEFRAIKKA